MRAFLSLALAGLIALATAGCGTASNLQDWTGRAISELIAKLGPATKITPYPFGGSVYIWETKVDQPQSIGDASLGDRTRQTVQVVYRRAAVVNESGIVTATSRETVVGK